MKINEMSFIIIDQNLVTGVV